MTVHHRFLLPMFAVAVLALASCTLPGNGDTTNELVADLGLSQATYQILDLGTGALTSTNSVPDLTTNNAYRSTRMVFRLVPAGSSTQGAVTGALGDGADPAASTVSLPGFYLGVFEVTQAQWAVLDPATTPWSSISVTPAGSAGPLTPNADHPAYGLSRVLIDNAIQTFNAAAIHRLALPTDAQWERACRAGSSSAFHWGDDASNRSAALPYALMAETRGATLGPQPVAQRQANPLGLYDLHGNVWEFTRTGSSTALRGGSWHDPLSVGRSSHIMPIDRGTAHALAGVRLVLIP